MVVVVAVVVVLPNIGRPLKRESVANYLVVAALREVGMRNSAQEEEEEEEDNSLLWAQV